MSDLLMYLTWGILTILALAFVVAVLLHLMNHRKGDGSSSDD
jgi:hypothetical protein